MIKKVLTLYLAFFATGVILSGCCDCSHVGSFRFRWTNLDLSNRSYTIDSGSVRVVPDSGFDFRGRNYAILTRVDHELIAANDFHTASFLNTAYACKCAESDYTPEHRIAALQIISVNSFDAL